MRVSNVASRYAKALFELAEEKKASPQVYEEILALQGILEDGSLSEYINSPSVSGEEKMTVLKKALADQGLNPDVYHLLLLLTERNRLPLFGEVVASFQSQLDHSLGVARGEVRSATPLGMEERARIEKMVHQAIGKKVILTYKNDPKIIGGLVAQVGSYTFDDSLESHLRRLNEELKRRAH